MTEEKKERETKDNKALSHLHSRDMQWKIGSYVDCDLLTNHGRHCKPGFTANKYVSPETGKVFDCTWYCLKHCKPKTLFPLFKNYPTLMRTTTGTYSVNEIIISFSSSADENYSKTVFVLNRKENDNKEMSSVTWRRFNFHRPPVSSLEEEINKTTRTSATFSPEKAAAQVCVAIMSSTSLSNRRNIPIYMHVKVKAELSGHYVTPLNAMFIGFNTPYIRPLYDWKSYQSDGQITAKLTLKLKDDQLPSLVPTPAAGTVSSAATTSSSSRTGSDEEKKEIDQVNRVVRLEDKIESLRHYR